MEITARKSKETARDYAFRTLRKNIVNLKLQPGSMVSEKELADEMDMDLRTVRKVEDGKGNPLATVLAGYMYLLEISPNILFRVEPCEEGILMDHLFRQLLNLKPEHIMMVCESAVHIRKWRDNHPDVLTLQDYFDAVNKDEVNETN